VWEGREGEEAEAEMSRKAESELQGQRPDIVCHESLMCLFFFFSLLGFELRASQLLGRYSIT
jgi:hypothetical protein